MYLYNELMKDFKGTMEEATTEFGHRVDCINQSPWVVGFRDRGMGSGDFAVLAQFNNKEYTIAQCACRDIAEHICKVQWDYLNL